MGAPVARRALLAAAMGASALAAPALTGCSAAGGQGSRGRDSVTVHHGTLTSRHWPGRTVHWRVARPGGGAADGRAPVVVVLHGRGGDADSVTGLHLDDHVASTGLAVASIDGGDTYWHRRRSGVDAGAVVLDDFLPLLGSMGLRTTPLGLLGWSMGGYGALLLAGSLGPRRVFGVAAESAALWQSPGDSAAGAFDDREDYQRHDVFASRGRLRGIPVRLDCGTSDPFLAADRAYAAGLPGVSATFDPGGHTEQYWAAHAGPQLAWLAARLRARSGRRFRAGGPPRPGTDTTTTA